MRVIIIGAGVAGSVLADLLNGRGDTVTVLEKDDRPGGMCKSYFKDGFVYEYGPHILAVHNCSEKSAEYIRSRIEVTQTELTTASYINGQLTYYPPSVYSADRLGLGEKVRAEIARLPTTPDEANFETYLVSRVGPTLYELFFKSFTRKFWGVEPSSLSADWAKTRRLGESLHAKRMFFNEKWCTYPRRDWNDLFASLLRNVDVRYRVEVTEVNLEENSVRLSNGDKLGFDFVISSMHIDELFHYRFGRLQYAGYRIEPVVLDRKPYQTLDGRAVSMTYYPQDDVPFCRVTDYGSFQRKLEPPYDRGTILTYEYPDHSQRLYPFTDQKNLSLFIRYLEEASKWPCLLTFGRMGLYKYLTTDTTVEMAFRAEPFLGEWGAMSSESRMSAYKKIRGDWSN